MSKAKALHAEISGVLEEFKIKCLSSMDEFSDASELLNHVLELNHQLSEEKIYYEVSTNIVQFNECNVLWHFKELYETTQSMIFYKGVSHDLLCKFVWQYTGCSDFLLCI